jgi:hypothetical protein
LFEQAAFHAPIENLARAQHGLRLSSVNFAKVTSVDRMHCYDDSRNESLTSELAGFPGAVGLQKHG